MSVLLELITPEDVILPFTSKLLLMRFPLELILPEAVILTNSEV